MSPPRGGKFRFYPQTLNRLSGIGMEADDLQCRNIVIRPADTAPVFVQKCLWQAAQRVAAYIEMA